MKITINLLPIEEQTRREQVKINARIFTLCFVIIAIFAGLAVFALSYLTNLRLDSKSIQSSINEKGKQIKNYQNFATKIDAIHLRYEIAQNVQTKSLNWIGFLSYFNTVVPNDIQITSFKATGNPSAALDLSGNASNYREALKFYEKLKSDTHFTNVTLKQLQKNSTSEASSVMFNITSGIQQE